MGVSERIGEGRGGARDEAAVCRMTRVGRGAMNGRWAFQLGSLASRHRDAVVVVAVRVLLLGIILLGWQREQLGQPWTWPCLLICNGQDAG